MSNQLKSKKRKKKRKETHNTSKARILYHQEIEKDQVSLGKITLIYITITIIISKIIKSIYMPS